MKKTLLLLLVLPGAVFATEPALRAEIVDASQPEVAAIRRAGEKATAALSQRLLAELTVALGTGGPENAVDFCHLQVPALTKPRAADQPEIVAVKRTSRRLRNMDNAPDAAEQLALRHVEEQLARGEPPPALFVQRIKTAGSSTPEWRVYRSVVIQPACLACHGPGDQLPAVLREALHQRYPQDAATGYRTGDWRGLIRATVRPVAATPAS